MSLTLLAAAEGHAPLPLSLPLEDDKRRVEVGAAIGSREEETGLAVGATASFFGGSGGLPGADTADADF